MICLLGSAEIVPYSCYPHNGWPELHAHQEGYQVGRTLEYRFWEARKFVILGLHSAVDPSIVMDLDKPHLFAL